MSDRIIRKIMRQTEFAPEGCTIDQEWDAERGEMVTYNVTWDIRIQQDFENPHRDMWYRELENIASILFEKRYNTRLSFKFSGLVDEVRGATTDLWRPRCSYLLMGGTWSFDTDDTRLTSEQAVDRIKTVYKQAWDSLLWCPRHQCFSNQADREGYLYCTECDYEKDS